jgi:hypothetical protein
MLSFVWFLFLVLQTQIGFTDVCRGCKGLRGLHLWSWGDH